MTRIPTTLYPLHSPQKRSFSHGAITFVYKRIPSDGLLRLMPHLQHHNLWRTWRSGLTVRFNMSGCLRSSVNLPLPRALHTVNARELERLKKRFMKLDRCAHHSPPSALPLTRSIVCSDGSGSIDRNEFLQIPQIANNPLASRMIAIFDEECVVVISRRSVASCSSCRWGPPVAVVALSTFRNSLEG
jgi:hypothetical protein